MGFATIEAVDAPRNISDAEESNHKAEFETLMRREGPRIYTLAVRLTGNLADGQDLAAETFVKAFRAFGSFRGEAAFGTWAYRICLNLWKNRVRYEKRRSFWKHVGLGPRDGEDEAPPVDPPAPDAPPDRALEQAERRRILEAALDRLDPEDRALLLLRETEEKSYEDIASLLDVPLGTVKSRLARAREKLQSLLKDAL